MPHDSAQNSNLTEATRRLTTTTKALFWGVVFSQTISSIQKAEGINMRTSGCHMFPRTVKIKRLRFSWSFSEAREWCSWALLWPRHMKMPHYPFLSPLDRYRRLAILWPAAPVHLERFIPRKVDLLHPCHTHLQDEETKVADSGLASQALPYLQCFPPSRRWGRRGLLSPRLPCCLFCPNCRVCTAHSHSSLTAFASCLVCKQYPRGKSTERPAWIGKWRCWLLHRAWLSKTHLSGVCLCSHSTSLCANLLSS